MSIPSPIVEYLASDQTLAIARRHHQDSGFGLSPTRLITGLESKGYELITGERLAGARLKGNGQEAAGTTLIQGYAVYLPRDGRLLVTTKALPTARIESIYKCAEEENTLLPARESEVRDATQTGIELRLRSDSGVQLDLEENTARQLMRRVFGSNGEAYRQMLLEKGARIRGISARGTEEMRYQETAIAPLFVEFTESPHFIMTADQYSITRGCPVLGQKVEAK
jgi:hypothetical protein